MPEFVEPVDLADLTGMQAKGKKATPQLPIPGELVKGPSMGFGLTVPSQLPPAPPAQFDAALAKDQRRRATSAGEVVQAIYRQDSFLDGLIAEVAGKELVPDPNYNVFKDPAWAEATKGIAPEYVPYLYKAHSGSHLLYLSDRLRQKQEDLVKLGDLSMAGEVGRFALGAVLPDNLLLAVSTGLIGRGVQTVRHAQAVKVAMAAAESPVAKAAALSKLAVDDAARLGTGKAVSVGVGFGAAENAAYEALRQSVNFEDDKTGVMVAGLLGAGMSAPFAWAGARSARKVAAVAERELRVLEALKAAEEGIPLTPEQGKLITETHKGLKMIEDLQTGKITEEQFLYGEHELVGPIEPPDQWMKRFGDRIAAEADDIIRTMFPGAGKTIEASPPPASGTVRMYHGGSPEGVDGPLWFTADLRDAKGWAGRGEGMQLWYVDVPEGMLGGDLPNGIAPLSRMELPPEIAGKRQLFREKEVRRPRVKTPASEATKAWMDRKVEIESQNFVTAEQALAASKAAVDPGHETAMAAALRRAQDNLGEQLAKADRKSLETRVAELEAAAEKARADAIREAWEADEARKQAEIEAAYNERELASAELVDPVEGRTRVDAILDKLAAERAAKEAAETEPSRVEADKLATALEAIPGTKAFAAGIRVRLAKPEATFKPEELAFYRSRLEQTQAATGGAAPAGKAPPKAKKFSLKAFFTEGREADKLELAKGNKELAPVVKEVEEAVRSLDARLGELGFLRSQVNSGSPALPRSIAELQSNLLGALGRLMNQHEAVAKKYKRADPAAMRSTLEDLKKDLKKAEELVAAKETTVAPKETSAPADEAFGLNEPPAEPPQAPLDPHSLLGEVVSFAHRKTGDTIEGKVEKVFPDGSVGVRDVFSGNLFKASPEDLDIGPAPVPNGFIDRGSINGAQVARIASVAEQRSAMNRDIIVPLTKGKVKIPSLRLDYFSILNRSQSLEVRKLAFQLVKDALQVDKVEAQGWTASEWRTQLKRVIGGQFHRSFVEASDAYRKAVQAPVWRQYEVNNQFAELVSRVTRGDTSALSGLSPDAASAVKAASAAQQKAYAAYLKEAKEAGVKGAENVPADASYVNRIWHHERIREAELKHGHDAVIDLIADAMVGSNSKGPLHGDRNKAEAFLKVVKSLEFNDALQSIHLNGGDMGTLRTELAAQGLDQHQIDTVVDLMFEARENSGSDAGQATNLRYRFDLDETLAHDLPSGTLRLTDLLENDARILVDRYGATMGGHSALARQGFASVSDFDKRLRAIAEEAMQNPKMSGDLMKRDLELLRDLHRNILGRPMSTQDFSFTNRFATAFRGYTRSVMLGQLGVAAAFEMKQAIALMGFRAFWANMPSFQGFITALRRGHLPDAGLARDVAHIVGWGNEKAAAYARHHEIADGYVAQALSGFEAGANRVSHAVDVISGNASFTSMTRQISGMMAIKHLHDVAHGRVKLTEKLKQRFVGQGIDQAELDEVLNDLKAYAVDTNGRLDHIRYEDWQVDRPDTYSKFQLYMSRQVRDVIQDQDIGETMPFMHSTLGKMFGELKTFFLVAHAKNFLKNLHYHDARTLQVWLIGFMGEMLAYSLQTTLNYGPDPERLTPEKIAKAAFFRMSAAGFVPFMAESGYRLASGESLVQDGMTTNTDVRSLVPPSFVVASRLINAPATAFQGLAGTDMTTKQEMRDLWFTFPGSNTWGLRALGNWMAGGFPSRDPSKLP